MSHELKTPLTAMRGYLETLQMDDGALPPDRRRRYLGTVMDETLRLERIVADLVDLARVETHAGALDVRVFAPARVFERVVRRHEHEALRRAIAIAPRSRPTPISSPAIPIGSSRSSRTWSPTRCATCPTAARSRWVQRSSGGTAILTVADTGTGIAAEHLPHVFDRFYKADPARAAAGDGAGRQRPRAVDRQGDRRAARRPHRRVERAGPHRVHGDAAARQRRRRQA